MSARRGRRAAALGLAAALLLAACGADGADEAPAGTGASAGTPPATEAPATLAPVDRTAEVADALAALEQTSGARVGVYAVDTVTGDTVAYRADERFGYASVIKALGVGVLLQERPADALAEPLDVAAEHVAAAGYSPVTGDRTGGTMTVGELAAAAVSASDNGAFNLLLRRLGGPAALQAALVDLGDTTTQVDAGEPDLNAFTPGEPARTSTPRVLADGLTAFALGDALTPPVREQYVGWLTGSTTGDGTIRAGAPADWVVGGKTGTAGRYGSRNDVAVLWPPSGAPVVLAVLTDRPEQDAEPDDALVAEAARLVLAAYRPAS